MYWLNNLEKHMLLKKSSGMQTAWRVITSHNFNEFGNVVVVYNLDFLHSKYLVCAIFLAFFFLVLNGAQSRASATLASCTPCFKNIHFSVSKQLCYYLLMLHIYISFSDTFPVAFHNNSAYIFIFNALFSFSEMFHRKVFVQMGD